MATFSLAAAGRRADSPFVPSNIKIADDASSADDSVVQGTWGGQQFAMNTGLPVLCKGPDGALGYYRIDAERSTQGSIFLIAV